VGLGGVFSAIIFYSLPNWTYGRGILFIQMILSMVFLTFWRRFFSSVFHHNSVKKDALIIGAGNSGIAMYELLESPNSPYRVVGFLDDDPAKHGKAVASPKVIGTTDQLMQIAAEWGLNTTILAINYSRPHQLVHSVLAARLQGMTILDMPTLFEKLTMRVPVRHIYDEWLLFTDGFYLVSKNYVQKIKRLVDLGVSSLLLLLTLPIIPLTALAIRVDTPGPIFFKQERIGKGGRTFILWKFRSMCQNAEDCGAVWCKEKDHRVTRVGKWIRLLRIDEIPQLYNVFRGEMTLIGPRPERPEFIQELEKQIPYYGIRHSVRPGITGWAQVNYRYGASVEDALRKLEYDLYYIKNMSLFLDLKIILKTIGVVLFGQGAR
ncbi:MAG: TIGR03013 family XrtA/PEP-CTERM system glycosyltransferase, partial [Candidatus Zixiibacteriota bacterium]